MTWHFLGDYEEDGQAIRASPPDRVWGMPTPNMGYPGFLGGGIGINWAPPVSGPP